MPMTDQIFHDWGMLKYALRGIETYMPFVENVYLVVSSQSQVPEWASKELKIVLHEDIIPEEFLPTFNDCTVDMFVHKIPGLDEEFLLFDGQTHVLKSCSDTDFFMNGRPVVDFQVGLFAFEGYRHRCRVNSNMAKKALGQPRGLTYTYPVRGVSPLLVSKCNEAFAKVKDDILDSLTRLHRPKNVSHQFFLDYLNYQRKVEHGGIRAKVMSPSMNTGKQIADYIVNPKDKVLYVPDVFIDDSRFEEESALLKEAFEIRLPVKSIFEK